MSHVMGIVLPVHDMGRPAVLPSHLDDGGSPLELARDRIVGAGVRCVSNPGADKHPDSVDPTIRVASTGEDGEP